MTKYCMEVENTTPIKRGQEYEVSVDKLAFGGKGIAKLNGYVIFVENAIPGQKVKVRITRKRQGFAEARVLEILENSKDSVQPKCFHFGECGGCRFQNLAYNVQLEQKRLQVIESIQHIGGIPDPRVFETIASPDKYFYRNKMEFSFGRNRWVTKLEIDDDSIMKPKDFALGMHVRGRYDKILDIDECYLQSELCVDILNRVKAFVLETKMPIYSTTDHIGFWRHLVIREGKSTGQMLVNFVTTSQGKCDDFIQNLVKILVTEFPEITTIVQNITDRKAEVALGEREIVLHGSGVINEKIGENFYQISANSFFQTNTSGAGLLYSKITEFADFSGNEIVYDLYAGAGSISLYISNKVKEVIGFEIVADAVKDANKNSDLNKISNCSFIAGDLKDTLEIDVAQKIGLPDILIIDPPRPGLHEDVVEMVVKLSPQKIVYVSCNPTTFARDLKLICESGYKLIKVQPVDMFPMTPHIELVSLIEKN